MSSGSNEDRLDRGPNVPLTPSQSILAAEIQQAVHELHRPASGLIMSGLIAGFGIGASVLAMAALQAGGLDAFPEATLRLLVANAYAVGFILVILANTDLFTEYTTIALLPVFTRDAPVRQLCRLWTIILFANLAGGLAFAALLVNLGPALEVVELDSLIESAQRLVAHPWWVILLSSVLAGWLMGLMSWLVSSTQETISQIFFVWIIGALIGLGHLHHAIIGAIEVFCGLLTESQVGLAATGRFLLLVTLGNISGGIVFAGLIRYSVLIRGQKGRRGREGRG